jgi:hypothetical protein
MSVPWRMNNLKSWSERPILKLMRYLLFGFAAFCQLLLQSCRRRLTRKNGGSQVVMKFLLEL